MVSWSHPAQPVLELTLHITASCETLHRSQAPTLTPDCSHCSVEAKSPSNRQQLKSSHSHNRFKPSENIRIRISIQRFFAFSSFYFTVLLVDHRVQLFPQIFSLGHTPTEILWETLAITLLVHKYCFVCYCVIVGICHRFIL